MKKVITIYLEEYEKKTLQQASKKLGMSMSMFLRLIIDDSSRKVLKDNSQLILTSGALQT